MPHKTINLTIPIIQSFVTSLLISVASYALANAIGLDRAGEGFWILWPLMWALAWNRYRAHAEYVTDEILLPPVAEVLPPAPIPIAPSVSRPIEAVVREPSKTTYASLDVPQKALEEIAKGVVLDGDFSMSRWAGAGKPLTRAAYTSLRDELIKRGLAQWVNPSAKSQGLALTRGGQALFRSIAKPPTKEPSTPDSARVFASDTLRTRARGGK